MKKKDRKKYRKRDKGQKEKIKFSKVEKKYEQKLKNLK